ncbi:autotransporter outer membrane beta-barrel domain-containing protein [Variovorax sp. J22G73]|uniref:autotransporter outer membrane beta-barrel domain-containing protein n=1 Tax=unclassified Variovorax TaxID=663243 RepID=UPI002577D755|nr:MULTISPECIES: autotransporter outer membrane beta-barrel domain-containing protein [unclassified Variovorax]MDM0005753.1 autotransporter outer membrane beta-barrel domain-containing protein [Variovorax sp. J22R203]MDM0099780.1 autotransporter outer membrane beta-barrel domain-containing protein [Variovorax sp. J22G73]
MNTNFRSVWNTSTGAWVAVSETAKARGKRSGSSVTTRVGASGVLLAAALFGSAGPAFANCVLTGNVNLCTGTTGNSNFVAAGTELRNEGVIGTAGLSGLGVVSTEDDVTVTNASGATIQGGGIALLTGANSVFRNLGGQAIGDNLGVVLAKSTSTVINSNGGTISSTNSYGIELQNGGEILNTGKSQILGQGLNAIISKVGATKITNELGSVIGADNNAINTGPATTLINAAQINGHVVLGGAGGHKVSLFTEGQIKGNLNIAGKDSVLTLDGAAGTTGVYSNAVTGETTFEGSVVKVGDGRWELDRTSSQLNSPFKPGSVQVAQGTLSVGAGARLDAAATVQVDKGSTLELNGAKLANTISGAGSLVVNGATASGLSGNNTGFTGGVTLASSALLLGHESGLGSGALTVTGSSGLDWTSVVGTLNNNVNIATGGKLALQGKDTLVIQGAFSGGGSLTKDGIGTLVLNTASTNTGPVVVNAGTLSIHNASGSATGTGNVQVNAGATLTGGGTISGQVEIVGGRLSVGNGIGPMSVGTLVLDGASSLDFDLGDAGVWGGANNDLLNVNGDLTLAGKLNIVKAPGGQFGAGLYRLINYTGTLTDAGMTINTAPGALSDLSLQTSISKQVNLVNTQGLSLGLWDGGNNGDYNDGKVSGGSGTWRAGSPAEGWTDTTGSVNTTWMQDSVAIFGATAGTVTVDNTGVGGAVRVGGVQFMTDGYVINGDALTITAPNTNFRVGDGTGIKIGMTATIDSVIVGAGGLQKDDVDTLVLTGANTYTGGTTLKAGTLSVANDAALGDPAGALTFDGGALKVTGSAFSTLSRGITLGSGGGTLDVADPFNTLAVTSTVGGPGRLVKTGVGTLTLASANTYAGGTSINGGTVNAMVSGALGTGDVAVNGGGGLVFRGTADAGNLSIAMAARDGLINGGYVEFKDKSSAGSATLVTAAGGNVTFADNSTAGNASIENRGGGTTVWDNATAGKAHITNFAGGHTDFLNTGSAGQATLVNETGGLVDFFDTATADQATVINNAGGRVRISLLGANGVSIGSLSGAGNVLLGTKALTTGGLNTDTEVSGVISGNGGSLVKVGTGALTLSGANTYTGGTSLRQGRLNVGHSQALGTGALSMDDDTTLGFSADGVVLANAVKLTGQNDPVIDTGAFSATIAGAISGGGFITKQGTGTLTLSGANTYTGATNVAQGTLKAGAANTFSAASAHSVAAGATLDLAGFNQSVASLANSGTVSLVGAVTGTTLTVNGNYVGNNGVLKLGTALSGTGPSDRLVINGGTASGKTSVQVTNLGGLGALTAGNGIEVVTAQGGATTTAQTTKDAFSLAGGHVDAGAYEYRLYAADASGAGENWFLRSSIPAATSPTSPGAPGVPIVTYRPEASLFASLPSQLRQGNLAMLGDLRKRVGDDDVKGTATAPTGSDRRAWARMLSIDIDIQQGGAVSPNSKGRLTGFQAGTDLLATSNWRAGLYVGQLDGDARVRGFASGIQNLAVGRNDLRSQYVGVYGTYTGDSGFYADAVVQSGRHRYTVEPLLSFGTGGKGNSLLGSIEVGQAFALGGSGWSVEPQLQLIHQHMDLGNSVITGAVVQPQADNGWIARAGVRLKGQLDTGVGTLQPYGRFNVYKTSSGADIARFVNGATTTDIAAPTGGTSSELAGGFTLALSPSTSLYGELGKLWASGGNAKVKSSVNGSLGVRVKW